jgi:hypothetical protein
MAVGTRAVVSAAVIAAAAATTPLPVLAPAYAQEMPVELLATLSDQEKLTLAAWRQATSLHQTALVVYWRRTDAKRLERRKKKTAAVPLVLTDYMLRQPPVYRGPELPPALARKIEPAMPPKPPPEPVPVVADFLRHAREHYGFSPRAASEREFKLAYASEALKHGLTREQVVGVYAFETGGNGTFDMQAGINPLTRNGRAITTALGYAQLLAANSVGELAKHGAGFRERLVAMARAPGTPSASAGELEAKAAVLGAMLADVAKVPASWDQHVAYARGAKGLAVHAVNLDGDIGPWLQVLKLKGLKDYAEKSGRAAPLAPADIELMNLAGPGSGIEMLAPLARDVPSANFFQRGGYERNRVVHGRTAATLHQEIQTRMTGFLARAGAVEFAAVFEEVAKRGQATGDR